MSRSGFGLSVGPRGASMSFGPSGTYRNVNLPGGFSYRDRVGGSTSRNSSSEKVTFSISVCLEDDGTVYFKDKEGNILPPHLQELTKKQQGETIKAWLAKNCEEVNQKIEALDAIHHQTPSPHRRPTYKPTPFTSEPPIPPFAKELGIFGRIFPWVRRRIESDNERAEATYQDRIQTWREYKAKHEQAEVARKILLEERLYNDPEAMQSFLEERLGSIEWPRETVVEMEITSDGRKALIEVNLPEIEDIPKTTAHYGGRGWKVKMEELSATKSSQLYMRHVHGIAFRVLGETFAALPTVQEVVLSGYSQRSNQVTGQVADEYLYSVRVSREAWSKLRFDNLTAINVTESLNQFELRREMSKTGVFKPIEPLENITDQGAGKPMAPLL